ncbi:MAG: cyclic pyranopterin monophosphate synthase MoaC [Candidatus Bathyarchaeota archaeon]|jgi:cyclic pyranopterin phosphate synthase|nr:cyclic pyranopterin monophosphate synthase MoaC [Candidatus Bathyarchaeota archaeon]
MEKTSRFKMVDISPKEVVTREATAVGRLRLRPETARRLREGKIEKGDPISIAEVAATLAAKNTSQLIPMCHNIPLSKVETSASVGEDFIEAEARVKATAKTGVEMEALVAVTMYLLNIWDMVKKVEKDDHGQYPETWIEFIKVKEKLKASTG